MKTKFLNVRVSEDTLTKLKELASAENRSQGNWIETLVDREYNKLKGEMKMLMKRIERAIETEAMKTGKMGTESVVATLILSESEINEFETLEYSENYHMELEGNELYVRWTEEV